MPKRIQRKRTKGWKMPSGAVYVGRPTIHGNPFRVGVKTNTRHVCCTPATKQECIEAYRRYLLCNMGWLKTYPPFVNLRGKDLVCWCPPDQPCHADVLLELANTQ